MKIRSENGSWGAAAVCALAGVALFQGYGNATLGYIHTASLFGWWAYQWVNPESESEHGLIVLALSAWLLVRNLRRAGTRGSDWRVASLAAMAAGMGLHLIGYLSQQTRISVVALLVFAWGASVLGGGERWGRAAVFPLAFMLFAVPTNALDSVGFWLRMWVVDASASLSHLFGIGVIRNGTQLLAPDGAYDYDVAAACSGVRSLTALAALSTLVGYLRFRPWFVRLAFLAMSLPFILVGNVARVVSIVLAARAGGAHWGDVAHEVMGYGVFAIALGGLFGVAELASWLRPAWIAPGAGPVPGPPGPPSRVGSVAAAAVTLALASAAALLLNHVSGLPSRGSSGVALGPDGISPVELPVFIGSDWMGQAAEVTRVEREILPKDTGFSRKTYVSLAEPSKRVFLSIVLSGRDRTSIHRPELCLVGQGWTILDSFTRDFSYPGRGPFPATVLRVRKQVSRRGGGAVVVTQLVTYFFVGGDTVVAEHWRRIALDAWNRVVHGRADRWAYVLMQTGDGDGEPAAFARIQTVLDSTLPVFEPKR